MQDRAEKHRLNRVLGSLGLPTLDAPWSLMAALGPKVEGHEHFKSIMLKVDPHERGDLYRSLTPHLNFKPKPLDVYIAEAAALADRKKLPMIGPNGELKPYRVAEFHTFWSTILKLEAVDSGRLAQTMRNLLRDIPEDKQEAAIFKVHIVHHVPTDTDYLRISAGIYDANGEAQRVQ